MFASFSAEILKLRKRPAVWMIVAAWMALEVMFGYLFPYLGYRTSSAPGPDSAGRRFSRRCLPNWR